MSKLLTVSVDVTKLDKSKFNKGKYCNLEIWVNDEPDQYGKDCSVKQATTKEEREAGTKMPYIGSGWKKFGWDSAPKPGRKDVSGEDESDEIPF